MENGNTISSDVAEEESSSSQMQYLLEGIDPTAANRILAIEQEYFDENQRLRDELDMLADRVESFEEQLGITESRLAASRRAGNMLLGVLKDMEIDMRAEYMSEACKAVIGSIESQAEVSASYYEDDQDQSES